MSTWRIHMIRYGVHDRNRPANFYGGDPHDAPMPMAYFNWVIENGTRSFVVDTGFDARSGGSRARELLRPVDEGLKAVGVDPAAVTDIIVTHMHYDHAGNTEMFPSARYHMQEAEMAFCTGKCMCHELTRHPFDEQDVVAMVRKVFAGRVEFYDGDVEIAPGISLHKIGGHSRGLQSVRVMTERGPVVIASDAAHYYEHIEKDRAFSTLVDLGELLEGYRKLRRLAPGLTHIVPGHDPDVLERYPPSGRVDGAVRIDLPPTR